jgi:N-acetylmuramoyl-L-alanine amidase
MRLFINAGHGGGDPGAVANGLREADITLKIGQRLNTKIFSLCTTKLFLSRNLSDIVRESNIFKADFFVSIHVNAHNTSSANGIETFCYKFGGKGEQLARSVQTQLIRFLARFDRGVKEGNFQVLRSTIAPAILTEIGFITNTTEANLMKTDKWIEDSAEALAIGISNYCGLGYKPMTTITPSVTPPATPPTVQQPVTGLPGVLQKAEGLVSDIRKLM